MNHSPELPALEIALQTGDEPFHRDGQTLPLKLLDFWRWSASDLTNNRMRGILAEFLVASALGIAHSARIEWDAHDLITFEGVKIEVKSAAYLQSWEQKKLSKIKFDIRPTRVLGGCNDPRRQAQIYVFCVLKHQTKSSVDPLNVEQWDFYVLPTEALNQKLQTQKSVTLSGLHRLAPIQARFEELADCVQKLTSP